MQGISSVTHAVAEKRDAARRVARWNREVVALCHGRGGHFAAAAYELQPPPKGSRKADDCVKVLAHRSFHRYVTRRKAGGRQSVADGAKSIKSAGSSIRRHNEAMLSRGGVVSPELCRLLQAKE